MSRPIGQTLAGLIAAEPTAAQHFQPQQADDAIALALNPHLTRARRHELVELAATQRWVGDLAALVGGRTGSSVDDVSRQAVQALAQQRAIASLSTLLQSYPASLLRNLHGTGAPEVVPSTYEEYTRLAAGGSLYDAGWGGELDRKGRLALLTWTVNDDGHPWHLSDAEVVDALRSLESMTGPIDAGRPGMTRLLRRADVRAWLAGEARKGQEAGDIAMHLAGAAVYSPYLPEKDKARRQILLCAEHGHRVARTQTLSPLLTADDVASAAALEPSLQERPPHVWGEAAEPILDVMRAASMSHAEEAKDRLRSLPRLERAEWAVAAEPGSPYVAALLAQCDLGVSTRDIGVHAVERLVDEHAVSHPEEAAAHRRRMAEQGWVHPRRVSLAPVELPLAHEAAEDPFAVPAGDLYSGVWPREVVRLPDEVTGLLDSHEAWQRLAHVAEQYPDLTLGAALLLARDTVAVPA